MDPSTRSGEMSKQAMRQLSKRKVSNKIVKRPGSERARSMSPILDYLARLATCGGTIALVSGMLCGLVAWLWGADHRE